MSTLRLYPPAIAQLICNHYPAVSHPAARTAVLQTLEAIRHALAGGNMVVLPGVGTLKVKLGAPRKGFQPGVGPKAGSVVTIPAKKRVYFTAEKPLLKELNP